MTKTIAPYEREHEPLPESSTLIGLLHVLRKAHSELVGEEAAHQRFKRISTRGDAKQYIDDLMPHLMAEREHRRRHRHGGKGSGSGHR